MQKILANIVKSKSSILIRAGIVLISILFQILTMILLIGILHILSYLKFCFDFPFTFTMNFRYIVPTLITYGVITGIASDDNKFLFYTNTILILLFSCLSILMFTNLI